MAYREVLRIKPDDPGARMNLGVAYDSLEQYDQAIKAYQEAIHIFNEVSERASKVSEGASTPRVIKVLMARAWFDLGSTYGHLKQLDQEVRAYQEAVHLNPNYVDAWVSLGFTYS